MSLSFAHRRTIIRVFWRSHDCMESAMVWFWEKKLNFKPRKHTLYWAIAAWWHTPCPICSFWRAWTLGVLFGLFVSLVFFLFAR